MSMHIHPAYPSFGFTGHETFAFRIGWLHKGVVAAKNDPAIFGRDDAIVTLGVGKNMVRSIRHWCVTLGLIDDRGKGMYEPTELGNFIFNTDGVDPYLEDIGTLWWLHWRLGRNSERCTTWHYVFNHLNRPEFSKSVLREELQQAVAGAAGKSPSERTIENDIECFVRTYTPSKKTSLEESLECPLVELNILKDYERTVRLNRGEKDTIPDLIFLAALIEFHENTNGSAKTMLVERVLHAEGSPGRIFLLDENSCMQRLERLGDLTTGRIVYDSTAGMRQILFHSVPDVAEILESYYKRG